MQKVKCPICNRIYEIEDTDLIIYSICDHCHWEYDPDVNYSDLNDYSDPNHMTIGEAIKQCKKKM